MKIERKENYLNRTYEYKITVLGLKFYRTLYQEQIMSNKYPFWYRAMKWWHPVLCNHDLVYDKNAWMNFGGGNNRYYKCEKCNKEIGVFYSYPQPKHRLKLPITLKDK